MFPFLCRRRVRVLPKDCVFVAHQLWAPQNPVFLKPFSSRNSAPGVCENDSQKSFTVSYLINSCGLSSKDAISASENLCFKSPEKPDAVLKLLRENGFTGAHIYRIVTRWPGVFLARPNKTLLPKLQFFRSIGVPLPVLAQKLSIYPTILKRSLEKSIIPFYNDLKSLLQSDERVVRVFSRNTMIFSPGKSRRSASRVKSIMRERGVPESSIASLVTRQPTLLLIGEAKLVGYVDRAIEMGFDISKSAMVHAIRVFSCMGESTLKHKMDVYKRCGWSESDTNAAFLRYPNCMLISEEKIMAGMEIIVRELGCKPVDVARYPVLLTYNLNERIKPRCLVAKILNEKGLTSVNIASLLILPEQRFLQMYIIKYQKNIPELLDIYRGSLSPSQVSKISK